MRSPHRANVTLSVILFALLSLFSFVSAGSDLPLFSAKLVWSLGISLIGLFIYRRGEISRYRSILFILIAVFFFLGFKLFRFFSITNAVPPYCHIAQAPTLLNFVYNQYLALTGGGWQMWGPLTLGALWLLIIFTIGQGICSWACFYGGIDEAFSKVSKRQFIKLNRPGPWRDFPIAFLIFLLIVSFLQGLPFFCNWFCPFKMTEAFWSGHPAARAAQAVLFWVALAGFLIALPVLTKKRTFCSLICPFGAFVSLCGRVSPYRVNINRTKCIACGRCQNVCPVLAIEDKDSKEYRITNFCNRCGRCIDVCPAGAIDISSGQAGKAIDARDIFIFLSLLLTGAISGTFVPRILLQLIGMR